MVGRFPYKQLSNYPHMKPRDAVIWDKFILTHPDFYDSVDYDVPCGTTAPIDEEAPDWFKADNNWLTSRHLDVVGYKGDIIDLIEIKPSAGFTALGQIISYDFLYGKKYNPQTKTRSVIITDDAERDIELLCEEYNVLLLEVGK